MGVQHCAYPLCSSDSRYADRDYMRGVKLIPFPKPFFKPEISKRWVKWLKEVRPDFSKINHNTYLCTKHFVGGNGPTMQFPDPIHEKEQLFMMNDQSSSNKSSNLKQPIITIQKPQISILKSNPKGNEHTAVPLPDLVFKQETVELSDSSSSNIHFECQSTPMKNFEDQGFSDRLQSFSEGDYCKVDQESELANGSTLDLDSEYMEIHQISFEDHGNNNANCAIVQSSSGIDKEANGQVHSLVTCFQEFFVSSEWLQYCHLNWFSSLTNERLQLHKANFKGEGNSIIINIETDCSFTLKVLSEVIENHNLIKLPVKISDVQTLLSVLKQITSLKICQGNSEEKIINFLKSHNRGRFSCITEAQHDEKCLKLSNKNTCVNCSSLRASAASAISKLKKNKQKKFKSCSKEELILLLRKSKLVQDKYLKKIKRLEIRSKKLILKGGKVLPEEDNEVQQNILEQST